MRRRLSGGVRALGEKIARTRPIHWIALGCVGVLAATFPAFVAQNLNPFRRAVVYFYEEPLQGKWRAEARLLSVGFAPDRRQLIGRLVEDYLRGPLEFRLRHPGNIRLTAIYELGNTLNLFLSAEGIEGRSPEFKARMASGLIQTLQSNELAPAETRIYWSGNPAGPNDPI